jgi:hypothetical protein
MSTPPNQPVPDQFSDVIALVDAADSWQELLTTAMSLARRESARLRLLILPSADNNARLLEVRAELQNLDIRTLPFGVQCTIAADPIENALADTLQETPQPLVLLRTTSAAVVNASVNSAVTNLSSPASFTSVLHDWPSTDPSLRLFVKDKR